MFHFSHHSSTEHKASLSKTWLATLFTPVNITVIRKQSHINRRVSRGGYINVNGNITNVIYTKKYKVQKIQKLSTSMRNINNI